MPSASFAKQRAVALTAERADVAIGRLAEIDRRNVPKILAVAVGAERELHARLPVAEIARQRPQRIHVRLAAHRVADRAVGAHDRRQVILKLALARAALADADALRRRRLVDVEAGARRELGQGIDVGRMNPVRAAVERHAEAARIGEAPPADAAGRLDQCETTSSRRQPPRRGDPGRARADDDHVDVGGTGRRRALPERRPGRDGGGACKESAAAEKAHGFPLMVGKWFLRRAAPNAIPIKSRCRVPHHGSRFVAAIPHAMNRIAMSFG